MWPLWGIQLVQVLFLKSLYFAYGVPKYKHISKLSTHITKEYTLCTMFMRVWCVRWWWVQGEWWTFNDPLQCGYSTIIYISHLVKLCYVVPCRKENDLWIMSHLLFLIMLCEPIGIWKISALRNLLDPPTRSPWGCEEGRAYSLSLNTNS